VIQKHYLTLQSQLNDDLKQLRISHAEFETTVFPPVSRTNPLFYLGMAFCGIAAGIASGIAVVPLAFSAAAIYGCIKRHVNQNYEVDLKKANNAEIVKKQKQLDYLKQAIKPPSEGVRLRNPYTLKA